MKRRAGAGTARWSRAIEPRRSGVSNADDTLPPAGATLELAFEALVRTFQDRGVRYAIIGGIATIQHTRVRTTDDIDALVSVPQIAMPGLFEALQKRGFSLDVAKSIHELRAGMTTIRFAEVLVDLMPRCFRPTRVCWTARSRRRFWDKRSASVHPKA
jgi:hypothetical protein